MSNNNSNKSTTTTTTNTTTPVTTSTTTTTSISTTTTSQSSSIFNTFSKQYNNIRLTKEQILQNLNEIRLIRNDFEEKFLLDTSIFFTDKLITLTEQQHQQQQQQIDDEIYRMSKLLQQKQQYHRSALMIIKNDLHRKNLSALYLAAKCYYDCKEYEKSLELLNSINFDHQNLNLSYDKNGGTLFEWKSSIQLLKGLIYQQLQDKEMANKFFFIALYLDPFCYEAFQSLIKFDMINKEQENKLLEFITTRTSVNNENDDEYEIKAVNMMKEFYNLQYKCCNHQNGNNESMIKLSNEIINDVNNSDDVQLIQAELYYNECEFDKSFDILNRIYINDILNEKCLFLMIGCLLELKNKILLQNISHKLIESLPESPITWYSIGCYYYLLKNMEQSRKFLNKSLLLNENYQPSMLMYGHTFESDALHDQALSVYLDLSKIMINSYLPLLYIGIEYCHLNFPVIAEQYLQQSMLLLNNNTDTDNIFILHELAIVYYERKQYEMSKKLFLKIYNLLIHKNQKDSTDNLLMKYPKKFEPIINNLGHVTRKLLEYDQSIYYFKLSIQLIPDSYQTLDSIGLLYALKNEQQMALDYFRKALSIKRDDAFALTMYHLLSGG